MIQFPLFNLFIAFLIALPLTLVRGLRRRHLILLVSNMVFLGLTFLWAPRILLALLVFTLANYGLIFTQWRLVEKRAQLARMSIIFNLAALVAFNYPSVFSSHEIKIVSVLPVLGLACMTLRHLQIVSSIRDHSQAHRPTLISYLNFVLFFPAYLSGPFIKYDAFLQSFEQPVPLTSDRVYSSLKRLTIGLFKLQVVSFLLGYFTLGSIDLSLSPSPHAGRVFGSAFVYGVWLFFSFSGVTDMAIGSAAILGVDLPENFNKPFLACNLQDFWRRWHMSMLNWIQEYVFIPALLVIKSWIQGWPRTATALATLFCFTCFGAWHGEGLHFIYYGLFHGTGLVIFFLYGLTFRSSVNELFVRSSFGRLSLNVFGWLLTWVYISIGWFLFLGQGAQFLKMLIE